MKLKFLLCFIIAALALMFVPTTQAEQGGSGHYASGSFTDFAGFPPTGPGFYLANYFLDYNDGTLDGSAKLPYGNLLAAGVTANLQVEAPLGIYAYPFDFHGITFSSGVGIPYEWVNVKAKVTLNNNGNPVPINKEQSVNGLGDIQLIPVMAACTNGDFRFGFLFNIWAPTGDYNTGQLANPGLGYWTFDPMLAFSWISSKIGTEFTLFTGLDFNTKNTDADYQSGDIYHLDATLAQHLPLFGGLAGAGASAFFQKQITGDSGSGAKLGSFESESYGVGPTISYTHPIGKSTLVVDASWLPQLHVENTTKGDYIWVKAALAF